MHLVITRCAVVVLALALGPAAWASDMDPEIQENVTKATVQVWQGEAKEGQKEANWAGSGSGAFINRTGLVITNNHVVDPCHGKDFTCRFQTRIQLSLLKYKIVQNGGTEHEVHRKALLLYQNEAADLALLQIVNDEDLPLESPNFLRLFPSQNVEPLSTVWLFGFPGGNKMRETTDKSAKVTVTFGNVIEVPRTPGGRIPGIACDVPGAPGNSGGPMVNAKGQIVGIVALLVVDTRLAAGANATCVPADLVGDAVRIALAFNKIRSDSDLEPFLALLADRATGVVSLPGLERQSDTRVRFVDGNETRGDVVGESLTWPSPLGTVTLPLGTAAYILSEDGDSSLLMDGGDLLTAKSNDISLQFRSNRGRERTLTMANVARIVLPRGNELDRPDVNAIMIQADGCRIAVTDIEGDLLFKDGNGAVELKLDELLRIEPRGFEQSVTTIDGSTFSGQFQDTPIKARLAWSGVPIELSLKKVRDGRFRRSNPAKSGLADRSLAERLEVQEADIASIAQLLEEGEIAKAKDLIAVKTERDVLKTTPKPLQAKAKALEAEALLRIGDYEEARQAFRKLDRSDNPDSVRWYSASREYLLDNLESGTFQGRPLSDPAVFKLAASKLTDDIIKETRTLMQAYSADSAKPAKHRDWERLIRKLENQETELRKAAALSPGRAENDIFRMWRFRFDLNLHEFGRLQDERLDLQRQQQDAENREDPQGRLAAALARKLARWEQDQQDVEREMQDLIARIRSGGFRLDDPAAAELID